MMSSAESTPDQVLDASHALGNARIGNDEVARRLAGKCEVRKPFLVYYDQQRNPLVFGKQLDLVQTDRRLADRLENDEVEQSARLEETPHLRC